MTNVARTKPCSSRLRGALTIVALATTVARPTNGQQPFETETARLPRRGELQLSATYEYQRSGEGTEHALPFAVEYGVTDRVALLVEPVVYTSIRARAGTSATGLGDLETTLQYLAWPERGRRPGIALAGEVKFPTAHNASIGTGRADFTPYLIVTKAVFGLDVHANVGYSFVGKPPGTPAQNTINFAFAIDRHVSRRFDLLAEVLSTTASIDAGEGVALANAPELAGAEQVGMIGLRFRSGSRSVLSLGVTYDNTGALLLRPGFTLVLP